MNIGHRDRRRPGAGDPGVVSEYERSSKLENEIGELESNWVCTDLDTMENLAIAQKDLAAFHKIVSDEQAAKVYKDGNEVFETDVGR